jgi:hypothetical protein
MQDYQLVHTIFGISTTNEEEMQFCAELHWHNLAK